MKKILALALVAILALSLAACGGSNDTSGVENDNVVTLPPASGIPAPDNTPENTHEATPNPTYDAPEEQAMASLIGWMMDGTFSYDYTMTSEGPEGVTVGTGSMAMEGANMAVASEMTVDGMLVHSRIIIIGEDLYIIDDASRLIIKMSGGIDPMMTQGLITDYTGIIKTGEGTGEIDGKTLPYEEYTDDATGATVRYYLDGGQVYGIESSYEGYNTVMIISNASGSVPSGAFDIPDGYTEMSI